MGTLNRGELAHFMDVESVFYRLAKGMVELSSAANPQEKETTYIDDSSEATVTGYQPSWSITGDVYNSDPVNDKLYDLAWKRAKGDGAVLTMINVQKWTPSENSPTKFKAYKQLGTWIPDNDGGGSGGETVTFGGNFKAKGDAVYGWATITEVTHPNDPDKKIETCIFS